jgi:hypothetical protein
MKKLIVTAVCLAGFAGLLLFRAAPVKADARTCTFGDQVDVSKITLCHADGHAGTTKFSEITVSCTGAENHFDPITGTPQAGHEDDVLGPCTKK